MATASATQNTGISFPGILLNANFPDLLDKRFDDITTRDWTIPTQGLEMYKVMSTTNEYEQYSSVTGLGLIPENDDEDNLPVDAPIQGFDWRMTPKTYRQSVRVTRKLREDDRQGIIDKRQKMVSEAMVYTTEYYAARPFNTGFTSTAQWVCSDGMYLFDSGRYTPDTQQSTWSNLGTGALTGVTLATERVAFRKKTQERGLISPLKMEILAVPPDLEQKAKELITSTDKPEGALNDSNWHKNAVKLKVWDYLTSTTAWFSCAQKTSSLYDLCWLWRVKPSHSSYKQGDNDDVFIQKVRARFVSGAGVPHALRGSTGS